LQEIFLVGGGIWEIGGVWGVRFQI
jgi:hypothetical protein